MFRRKSQLIGLTYVIENIEYTNATSVKVLQVGQPTNIMIHLNMTAYEYNLVQLIYFVSGDPAFTERQLLVTTSADPHSTPSSPRRFSSSTPQISYIIIEVPRNLFLKWVAHRNWQFRIILSRGIVLAGHAAVKETDGLYTVCFFLGTIEAGIFLGLALQFCS
ncbi:hypothetical protein DL95DRAFT_410101 [Leptodontidium sp. 2 PMI_412]|nr:hypothetical protein DL95DRAFT_410101 [Leptodontidium sp. 2 PMI_412]